MVQLAADVSEVRGSRLIQQSGSSHTRINGESWTPTHTQKEEHIEIYYTLYAEAEYVYPHAIM